MSDSIIPLLKKIPWKLVFSILAAVGVIGTGGSMFLTADQAKAEIQIAVKPIKEKIAENKKSSDKTFTEIKGALKQVQTVQHAQVSRGEARRITKDIDSRDERERAYDRLVGMSMRRLKNKKEPCLNLDCSN